MTWYGLRVRADLYDAGDYDPEVIMWTHRKDFAESMRDNLYRGMAEIVEREVVDDIPKP